MKTCQCVGATAVEVVGLCDPDEFAIGLNKCDLGQWTQISIPEIFQLPCSKPDIASVDKVFVDVQINSVKVVKTPAGKCGSPVINREGLRLTGKKLVVEGVLKQKVVYTAARCDQPVHFAHFEVPFSAFIVLACDTSLSQQFCVETCVEDVFAIPFNCREIFKNVTLFIQAIPV
ncbi:DUF3794 domain-containing protein [Sporomusa aerivorans]|uniref:DUF3794 domain-containing protein n=1 Tax=Sporomusa aerivorans TaxID=204936 RepID=UPI00352A4CEB